MKAFRRITLSLFAMAPAAVAAPALAQQVRTLPAPDATFEEPFTQLGAGTVRELRNGRVVVADPRDKILQLIDVASGEAVKIGREGSGPGEYGLPARLFGAPGDTTLVFDIANQRYLVIAPDGKAVNSFRLEAAAPAAVGGRVRISLLFPRASDSQGRLYYETTPTGGPDGGQMADSVAIMRYDRARQRHDTVGMIKIAPPVMQTSGTEGNVQVMMRPPNPLLPRDEWTVFPDGRVAIVRASDYHVDWVMADGTKRSSARISFPALRMGASDIKEEEALRVRAQSGQMRMMISNDNGAVSRSTGFGPPPGGAPAPLNDWPELKPPFRPGMASIWARPNGELWVRRMEPAGAKGTLFDVINAQGVVTHKVRVPEGVSVVGMGNGTVYTIRLDEDDLQHLQRHRM